MFLSSWAIFPSLSGCSARSFPFVRGYYASYVGHLLKLEILPDMVVDKQQYRLGVVEDVGGIRRIEIL